MSHHESDSIADESNYPQLELPDFESTIPPHLLEGVSKETQFVMENLNIQTQYIKWLCQSAMDTNMQVRKTNGRLKKVEGWKEKISSFWIVGAAILTFSGTVTLLVARVYKAIFTDHSFSIF